MVRLLVAHPRALGETYFEHQRHAFAFSAALLSASAAALVHGLLPCFFQTTASRTVEALHASMLARAANSAPEESSEVAPAAG